MACVVRYSFLLISICLRNTSFADPKLKVTSLIGAVGKEIIIQCATNKTPQDGVYMYKKGTNTTTHQVFYYFKDNILTPKATMYEAKVRVDGKFPNLNVAFSNVNTADIGLYWCEFNLEDKITFGTATWLLIDAEIMKNSHDKLQKNIKDTGEEKREGETEDKEDKKCLEDPHVKIVLIVCAVLSLLCIIGFVFVILKVKGHRGNKKHSPSKQPPDSVYEEMKRSNLDVPPSVRMFINPDYQSAKLLR